MSKERLTVADEDLGNGMKRCHIIDGNEVRKRAMDFYWRLKEYEDLEEQGLLLRLPCPIGTKIYYIQKCLALSCEECLWFRFTKDDNCRTQYKAKIFEQEFDYRHLKMFGKRVFLTKEEAEEKLRELTVEMRKYLTHRTE